MNNVIFFWLYVQDYALINRVRGPYEEIFVLTFKAYGPNAVRLSNILQVNYVSFRFHG